jgi:predicted nucleic acid-binding protein
MRVVVDANVVFSCFLGRSSYFRNALFNAENVYFAPNFLLAEIFKHKSHLLKRSSITEPELLELLVLVLEQIRFVNEQSLSISSRKEALSLCSHVDPCDTPYVALALDLEAHLWTTDKVLKDGLSRQGFRSFYQP